VLLCTEKRAPVSEYKGRLINYNLLDEQNRGRVVGEKSFDRHSPLPHICGTIRDRHAVQFPSGFLYGVFLNDHKPRPFSLFTPMKVEYIGVAYPDYHSNIWRME
jgi:hypothetical protein